MTQEASDAMLMALADGELPEPEAGALRARIAADPALAGRFAVFVRTRAALREAFPPEPVPASLIAAILEAPVAGAPAGQSGGAVVVPLPARRRVTRPLALAASVVLAVGLGGFLSGRALAPDAPVSLAATAVAALGDAVTGQAAPLAGGAEARVLGSFDTDVGLCRLVGVEAVDGARERVLACRDAVAPGGWQVMLEVAQSAGSDAFLPASDGAEVLIDSLLDTLGAGPALTEAEERAALAR